MGVARFVTLSEQALRERHETLSDTRHSQRVSRAAVSWGRSRSVRAKPNKVSEFCATCKVSGLRHAKVSRNFARAISHAKFRAISQVAFRISRFAKPDISHFAFRETGHFAFRISRCCLYKYN